MTNIIPVLHRVLILPDKVEETSKGGIVLSIDIKREQAAAEKGTVVAIGSTAFRDYGGDEYTLKVNDKVAYAKYAGKSIKENDIEYIILNDEDITAIIKE